jgi:hypothetical protein
MVIIDQYIAFFDLAIGGLASASGEDGAVSAFHTSTASFALR